MLLMSAMILNGIKQQRMVKIDMYSWSPGG